MIDLDGSEVSKHDLAHKGKKCQILRDIELSIDMDKAYQQGASVRCEDWKPTLHSKEIGLLALAEYGGGDDMNEREVFWEQEIKYWQENYASISECVLRHYPGGRVR